jgi:hypothetical protein
VNAGTRPSDVELPGDLIGTVEICTVHKGVVEPFKSKSTVEIENLTLS